MDHSPSLEGLTASEIHTGLVAGDFTAESVTRSCLDRIQARESEVRAWAHLDVDHAIAQARERDAGLRSGAPPGPLHGVPVGVKDIFDTHDLPTEWGSPLCAGRRPAVDSETVRRLRSAGAVILGKTVTTEFANWRPGPTRNPLDPNRTPGGSSSGSAAAVCDHMVPMAIGSQTGGSTIRPASFCGVVGFKPTIGLVSLEGVMPLAASLDHVGLFSRTVGDIGLLASVLYDNGVEATGSTPTVEARLAFSPTPFWMCADPDARRRLEAFAEATGLPRIDLPTGFEDALDVLDVIYCREVALGFAELHRRVADQMGDRFLADIQRGQRITEHEYEQAVARRTELTVLVDEVFEHHDALVVPAAPGVAGSLETTGDAVFNSGWTLCGNPAVCLPLLTGESGLPLGVQLIGRRGRDADLLAIAGGLEGMDWFSEG